MTHSTGDVTPPQAARECRSGLPAATGAAFLPHSTGGYIRPCPARFSSYGQTVTEKASAEQRLKELGISFRLHLSRSAPMRKQCRRAICFF